MAKQLNINSQTETQGAPGHTPGPWRSMGGCVYAAEKDLVAIPAQRPGICEANDRGDFTEANRLSKIEAANARLIAAAPDMLAFLEQIEDYLDEREDTHFGVPNVAMRLLAELRPLLARSRG